MEVEEDRILGLTATNPDPLIDPTDTGETRLVNCAGSGASLREQRWGGGDNSNGAPTRDVCIHIDVPQFEHSPARAGKTSAVIPATRLIGSLRAHCGPVSGNTQNRPPQGAAPATSDVTDLPMGSRPPTVFTLAGELLSSQRLVSEPHSSTCGVFFAQRDDGERTHSRTMSCAPPIVTRRICGDHSLRDHLHEDRNIVLGSCRIVRIGSGG